MRVREHQSARKVVSCDVPIRDALLIATLKQFEGLLDVKVGVLEQQLSLLFDKELRLKDLLPQVFI